jgi:hypothetical protein
VGAEPRVSLPAPLFDVEDGSEELDYYAPDPSGQRFLVRVPPARAGAASIHAVLNGIRRGE